MLPSSLPLAALDFGAAVWRADALAGATGVTVATGHGALDTELPGGGWPLGAITEILQAPGGQQEWRLLLPALARRPGPVVLVGPPHVPFGPGLAAQGLDGRRLLLVGAAASGARLWAAEQALRCAPVAAVLVWLPQARAEQLRRLQLAAHAHSKLLFVLRPEQAMAQSSPAVLRLLASVQPDSDALWLHILKRRGPPREQPLSLAARPARLAALLATCGAQAHAAPQALAVPRGPVLRFLPRSGDALVRTAAAA